MDVPIPNGDAYFPVSDQEPDQSFISLSRSVFELDSAGVRQQVNMVSSFLDAGPVYGHSNSRLADILDENALDEVGGTGRLRTDNANGYSLLPRNTGMHQNGGGDEKTDLFLAGDVRTNEQVNLIVIHTLWMREHNLWADAIRTVSPDLTGQEVFELARTIVQAEIQKITYDEYLPVLLGTSAIPPYQGYNPDTDPTAENCKSTI